MDIFFNFNLYLLRLVSLTAPSDVLHMLSYISFFVTFYTTTVLEMVYYKGTTPFIIKVFFIVI